MALRALGIVGLVVATTAVLLFAYSGGSATQPQPGDPALAVAAEPLAALPEGSSVVRLTAAGDHGGLNDQAGQTLNLVGTLAPAAHLALGDLSYSQITPESAWCDWVRNGDPSAGVTGVGSIPFQLVGGNHEEDSRADGFIRDFAACLPDRLGAVGDYGVEYYTDIGGLVRVIMIAADVTIDGEYYDYTSGPHRTWLEDAVVGARTAGIPWVVVGMHKVCVTVGTKSCEVGESVMDWLLQPGHADLILQGHDHGVQRSHQLSCVDVNVSTSACLVDTDGAHAKGEGGVILIGGSFGRAAYAHSASDRESGYFASWLSDTASSGDEQQGLWQLDFAATTLTARWVGSTSSYTDAFTVSPSGGAPPPLSPADDRPAGNSGSEATSSQATDVVAPRVGLKVAQQGAVREGKVRFRIACPAREQSSPCSGVLRLKTQERLAPEREPAQPGEARRRSLGSKRFLVQAGAKRTVVVALSKRSRTLASASGRLRVRAVAIAQDALGNKRRVHKVVLLRDAA